MTSWPTRFAAILALALPSVAAAADRCTMERAVFQETEAGMRLAFKPVGSDVAAVSHLFTITAGGLMLNGHVMFDDDIKRQVGMVMHNCPDGDVTGDDLRACTIWQGFAYGIDGKGDVGFLPEEGAEPPQTILLPGLGAAAKASRIGAKLPSHPWDAFVLKGCS